MRSDQPTVSSTLEIVSNDIINVVNTYIDGGISARGLDVYTVQTRLLHSLGRIVADMLNNDSTDDECIDELNRVCTEFMFHVYDCDQKSFGIITDTINLTNWYKKSLKTI